MRPYGVRVHDIGCCPGHDKYGGNKYCGKYNHQKVRILRRAAKRRARREGKEEITMDQSINHTTTETHAHLGYIYYTFQLENGKWANSVDGAPRDPDAQFDSRAAADADMVEYLDSVVEDDKDDWDVMYGN